MKYRRSNLGGHFAGFGMEVWESDPEYNPMPHRYTEVKFEHDDVVYGDEKNEWHKLNGEIKTYKVDEI
ncbi:hypothetical protein SAMN05192534_12344 [Alteribacillus persepolensis]|uniref:Uncharacterized protein n=1 Tax=Alteribacillus persepolensis TaxID=568899 RepID=A0A1G8I8U3_9BACI|nr:hypothetical protein [Alteribacillus persepolensis]SDI15316.1 hypothetical protein SAMN05192534_12344 [Alteribacillus persepolensis]